MAKARKRPLPVDSPERDDPTKFTAPTVHPLMREQMARSKAAKDRGAAPAEGDDMEGATPTRGGDPKGPHYYEGEAETNYMGFADRELKLTPQEKHLYKHHLDNLDKGGIQMPEGGTATLQAKTFNIDGRSYVLPTIWDNKQVDDNEAVSRAEAAGLNKYPAYHADDAAAIRYFKIHKYMDQDLQSRGM